MNGPHENVLGDHRRAGTAAEVRQHALTNWLVALVTVLVCLVLLELGIRIAFPRYRLAYTDAAFSARYHHSSAAFNAMLAQIVANPAAFKADYTIAIIGDSFVEGREVPESSRFTSLLQADFDRMYPSRVKVINLGQRSYSTMIYERLYRDIVVPLAPDLVLVCLDETDAGDDKLYEGDLLPSRGVEPADAPSDRPFADTILQIYERYPARFFLLRHSRVLLALNDLNERMGWSKNGSGFIPVGPNMYQRSLEKVRYHLETTTDPRSHPELFPRSERFIGSIARLNPASQQLYFVTYPRAENLAGQKKTSYIGGALPDSHSSVPYFEYWIERTGRAAKYPQVGFVHTREAFRAAIARAPRQYYFYENDVHWNEDGNRVFATILKDEILERTNLSSRLGSSAGGR